MKKDSEAEALRRLNVKLGLIKPLTAEELAELRLRPVARPNRHARRRAKKLGRK
jgi:hypothetical protein